MNDLTDCKISVTSKVTENLKNTQKPKTYVMHLNVTTSQLRKLSYILPFLFPLFLPFKI